MAKKTASDAAGREQEMEKGECDTLLIADDNEMNRGLLCRMFSSFCSIEQAENGKIALEKILSDPQKYCAVLLDIVMPETDGLKVLYRMQREGLMDKIPVFLLVEEAGDAAIQEAYRLGVMDIIRKPVIPYVVTRRISSIIELFQSRRRLSSVIIRQQTELLKQAQEIIDLNRGMVETLATAIEFRNDESGEHVRRIHDITKYMLENTALGRDFVDEEIEQISLASIMHDVGKIAIPDAILGKPGKLTAEEFEIMKTHTVQGAQLLEKISQLRKSSSFRYAYDIARHHHERWDGSGYPDGLKGDEISIWAQIVSLADVYDALRCRRVYKEAFSREKTLNMIRSGQCGSFNPELLECFFAVEDQLNEIYEREETDDVRDREERRISVAEVNIPASADNRKSAPKTEKNSISGGGRERR